MVGSNHIHQAATERKIKMDHKNENNILTFTLREIMNNSKDNVDYIQTFKSSTLLDCHEKCFGGSVG